jgi:hypothetical protein
MPEGRASAVKLVVRAVHSLVRRAKAHACCIYNSQNTSAYVSIRQHTSAYVSIRQHTSAYVRRARASPLLVALLALLLASNSSVTGSFTSITARCASRSSESVSAGRLIVRRLQKRLAYIVVKLVVKLAVKLFAYKNVSPTSPTPALAHNVCSRLLTYADVH